MDSDDPDGQARENAVETSSGEIPAEEQQQQNQQEIDNTILSDNEEPSAQQESPPAVAQPPSSSGDEAFHTENITDTGVDDATIDNVDTTTLVEAPLPPDKQPSRTLSIAAVPSTSATTTAALPKRSVTTASPPSTTTSAVRSPRRSHTSSTTAAVTTINSSKSSKVNTNATTSPSGSSAASTTTSKRNVKKSSTVDATASGTGAAAGETTTAAETDSSAALLEAPHNSNEKEIVPFFTIGAHCATVDGNNNSTLHFVDNDTVLYCCGAYLVLHNIDQKYQKFISLPQASVVIDAVALDIPYRLLAFVIKGGAATTATTPVDDDDGSGNANNAVDVPAQPTVYMYDLLSMKRRKTMCIGDGKSPTHQCIAFTPDAKMLVTLGGAPDYTLQLWNWEKSRIHAQTRIGTLACEVRPRSSTEFLVYGPKVFRVYMLRDTGFKLVASQVAEKFVRAYTIVSAEWCEDSVIVSVEHGRTFVWNVRDDTLVPFAERVAKSDRQYVAGEQQAEEAAAAMTTTTSRPGAAAAAADDLISGLKEFTSFLHGTVRCLKMINPGGGGAALSPSGGGGGLSSAAAASSSYLSCAVGHHGVQLWRKKLLSK